MKRLSPPHRVGVLLPLIDPGAALPGEPPSLYYSVNTDEIIRLRRRAGDVEIVFEHQVIE